MKETFNGFEEPHAVDLEEVDRKIADSGKRELGTYESALHESARLKSEITSTKKRIAELQEKSGPVDYQSMIDELERNLQVSERDLEEAEESVRIEEIRMQNEKREARDAALAQEKDEAETEAYRVDMNRNRIEASKMNDEIDAYTMDDERNSEIEKKTMYEDGLASAKRSLAYYAQGQKKIERQRAVVAGIDGKEMSAQKATEMATLENMEKTFPAQEADAKKFVEQMWGKSIEEHNAAMEMFSMQVKKAEDVESLLKVIEEWGAVPEGNKFVTYTKFRGDVDEILALQSNDEKIAALEKVTKNDEVCEKLLELYRKEYAALVEVEETPKKGVSLAMRQPNIEVSPEVERDPELMQEYMKARAEEKELQDLSEMVSSNRFKWFPASFMTTYAGRKNLKMLHDLHIPIGSRYERETSALIAVSLRLKAVEQLRENIGEQLKLPVTSGGLRPVDRRALAVSEKGYTPPPQRYNWNKFGKRK